MDISRHEILRYLGYDGHEADEAVLSLIHECVKELEAAASPRSFYLVYPLTLLPDDEVDFTIFRTKSRSLSRNLKDCNQALIFAATLGARVDVLLNRYAKLSISRAVTMQAAATAMIEGYCDEVNERLIAKYEARAMYLRPRFSPGYGDFPLECQRDITAFLETPKRIGVMLTDSLMMTPSKSVTAVMGIGALPPFEGGGDQKLRSCNIRGCEMCAMKDCAYRRG